MRLRGISAKYVFAVTLCAAFLLMSFSYKTEASESGPDWTHDAITLSELTDYAYKDSDQYMVTANIPQEQITAGKNTGLALFPTVVQETNKAFPTGAGYFSQERVLPTGDIKWQIVDTYGRPGDKDALFPNPATSGMISLTGMHDPYNSTPKEVRYVSDWRTMFSEFSTDSSGNVIRKVPLSFAYANEALLKKSDGNAVYVPSAGGVSYAKNGRWAYLNATEGQMRVELPSLKYQVFAPYSATQYTMSTAVSNSGRFVAVANSDSGVNLYDLQNCQAEVCAKRDIQDTLRSEYTKTLGTEKTLGVLGVMGVKFINESTLQIHAWVSFSDATSKYIKFTVGVDPGPQTTRYLALGDSFSSGEGALSYRNGTNFYVSDNNYNLCHQSLVSYPYILNKILSPDWFGDVACSGAVMDNVVYNSDPQMYFERASQARGLSYPSNQKYIRDSLIPGYIDQVIYMAQKDPTLGTISIGGNDIGFGDIVTKCVIDKYTGVGDCYSNRDDREKLANLIDQKIPFLTSTLKTIRNNLTGKQQLFVIGYPQIVNPASESTICNLNVHMTFAERSFTNRLVEYLNEAIRIAANNAGVRYVDVSTAFYNSDKDYRLCGNQEFAAVNGLTTNYPLLDSGSKSIKKPDEKAYSESYHPNVLGHVLLARQIRSMSNDFQVSMPTPSAPLSNAVSTQLRKNLVGDAMHYYNDKGFPETDIMTRITSRGETTTIKFSTNETQVPFKPGTDATIELHSVPIALGSVPISSSGMTTTDITIPISAPLGYHELHIYYTDVTGQKVDIYQYIYIMNSTVDFDGDGVPDSQDKCMFVPPSYTDADHDGVDDACDGDYTITNDENPNEVLINKVSSSGAITQNESKIIKLALANTPSGSGREPESEFYQEPVQFRKATSINQQARDSRGITEDVRTKENFLQRNWWAIILIVTVLSGFVIFIRRRYHGKNK